MKDRPVIPSLLSELGGSYAAELGIELDKATSEEIYKWFIAAILYGARISHSLAARTWREFAKSGVLTPQRVLDTGWDELVAILDRGGYARYDYKTATKLLDVNRTLLKKYNGNLNALHDAAADAADLEQRIMALGKGIGPVTANIFLREMRGRWDKATPSLSPLAFNAALKLGLLPMETKETEALSSLQALWNLAGYPLSRFCEFEAALVRAGLNRRTATLQVGVPARFLTGRITKCK
jgi:hypothetical protein